MREVTASTQTRGEEGHIEEVSTYPAILGDPGPVGG